jgi:D-sedoheptulose 7-phosphate isomerase
MQQYVKNFFKELDRALNLVSWKEIAYAIKLLYSAYENNGKIYLIGNGGSAAIASHFANDLNKTVFDYKKHKKIKKFQAITLCENVPLLTAWANDVGYKNVFSEQLKNFAQDKDVLVVITSSGKSVNIIEAVKIAKNLNLPVIGFVGFDGGDVLSLSDAKIHIPSFNYAIVESAHHAICHLITIYFKDFFKNA